MDEFYGNNHSETQENRTQPEIDIHESSESLIIFMDNLKHNINVFRQDFKKVFNVYINQLTALLNQPPNQTQPTLNSRSINSISNENIKKVRYASFRKANKIYKRVMNVLNNFMNRFTQDYAETLNIAIDLSTYKQSYDNFFKRYINYHDLEPHEMYARNQILNSIVDKYNKLAITYNERIRHFEGLKGNILNRSLIYTTSTGKRFAVSISDELDQFKELAEYDQVTRKRSSLVAALGNQLDNDLRHSVNNSRLLEITPIRGEYGNISPAQNEPLEMNAEDQDQSYSRSRQSERYEDVNLNAIVNQNLANLNRRRTVNVQSKPQRKRKQSGIDNETQSKIARKRSQPQESKDQDKNKSKQRQREISNEETDAADEEMDMEDQEMNIEDEEKNKKDKEDEEADIKDGEKDREDETTDTEDETTDEEEENKNVKKGGLLKISFKGIKKNKSKKAGKSSRRIDLYDRKIYMKKLGRAMEKQCENLVEETSPDEDNYLDMTIEDLLQQNLETVVEHLNMMNQKNYTKAEDIVIEISKKLNIIKDDNDDDGDYDDVDDPEFIERLKKSADYAKQPTKYEKIMNELRLRESKHETAIKDLKRYCLDRRIISEYMNILNMFSEHYKLTEDDRKLLRKLCVRLPDRYDKLSKRLVTVVEQINVNDNPWCVSKHMFYNLSREGQELLEEQKLLERYIFNIGYLLRMITNKLCKPPPKSLELEPQFLSRDEILKNIDEFNNIISDKISEFNDELSKIKEEVEVAVAKKKDDEKRRQITKNSKTSNEKTKTGKRKKKNDTDSNAAIDIPDAATSSNAATGIPDDATSSNAATNVSDAATSISDAATNIIDAATNISDAATNISDAATSSNAITGNLIDGTSSSTTGTTIADARKKIRTNKGKFQNDPGDSDDETSSSNIGTSENSGVKIQPRDVVTMHSRRQAAKYGDFKCPDPLFDEAFINKIIKNRGELQKSDNEENYISKTGNYRLKAEILWDSLESSKDAMIADDEFIEKLKPLVNEILTDACDFKRLITEVDAKSLMIQKELAGPKTNIPLQAILIAKYDKSKDTDKYMKQLNYLYMKVLISEIRIRWLEHERNKLQLIYDDKMARSNKENNNKIITDIDAHTLTIKKLNG
ncbi:conserved uncharacterized protein 35a-like protein-14, partial [Microplitis demolitor]